MSYTPISLGGISDVLSAGVNVAQDPCLTEVAKLTIQLHTLEQPKAVGATAPASTEKGIGLCRVVTPLRAYVWTRKHPWSVPLGAVAVIGGLVGLGYVMGRRARGRRS